MPHSERWNLFNVRPADEEPEPSDDDELVFTNYEDEFACEDMEPSDEPVVVRQARTARKARVSDEEESEEEPEDDTMCKRCGKGDHPEWVSNNNKLVVLCLTHLQTIRPLTSFSLFLSDTLL